MNQSTSTTVYAQEGVLYRSSLDYGLVLSLKNGTEITSDTSDKQPEVVTFQKLEMPLNLTPDGFEFGTIIARQRAISTSERSTPSRRVR